MKFLVLLFLVSCATSNMLQHERQEEEGRSIADIWRKVKIFFNNLQIELKEKYMRFGEWVKNAFKEGLDEGASAVENIKAIAKKFIENAENISNEVAHEAKEFFGKHKEDLGDIWDKVKKTVHDIKKRHDTKPRSKGPFSHRRRKGHKKRLD